MSIEFIRELPRYETGRSACLVRNTTTGQHYVVSTIPGETVAFKCTPDGSQRYYIRIPGGPGMHRCEVMRLLDD